MTSKNSSSGTLREKREEKVAFIFEAELRNKERKSPGDSLLNVALKKKKKEAKKLFSVKWQIPWLKRSFKHTI